jgi:hypothetical protein
LGVTTSMEQEILQSWQANANNWVHVLDNALLPARTLVTNNAIIQTIKKYNPVSVVDVGCGEGWLCRALQLHNINTIGFDAIENLVNTCIERDKTGLYFTASYNDNELIKNKIFQKASLAICNFSLIGNKSTNSVIETLALCNMPIIIQTLHADNIEDNQQSGWKNGSWAGMEDYFTMPYKWYYRTLEDWYVLFKNNNLNVKEVVAPIHPVTQKPASIIFELEPVTKEIG